MVILGTRESLKNNYLYHMHRTVARIWGNVKEEAVYHGLYADSAGLKLDGAKGATRFVLPRGICRR